MSESEATPTIRRSGRERKKAQHFTQDSGAGSRKRKRDTEDEGGNTTDKFNSDGDELEGEDHDDAQEDEDDGEDYSAPKVRATNPRKQPVTTGASKEKTKASSVKKPRTTKAKGVIATRKAKPDASIDVVKQIKDSHISDDNVLFKTILNPAAALQSTVEDYLDSLSSTPGLALADLVNCVLRACGCNESVDTDQVMDSDGVVDVLDTFTEGLKQANVPLYPLASKLPVFKKFRKQLSEFFHRLITAAAELGSLYTSDLLPTLQSWVIAMSSSQLRSLRHTATVVAMDLESALCEVAAEVEKEVVVIARQREAEKKRAGKTKGKGREKEFEGKAEEVRERKNRLNEYLREFFDGVFVHRYRDHDPGIRGECVQAMGLWLKRHPAYFLEGSYLRYIGWVLFDADAHVRLEAVRSLLSLYDRADYMGALQQFTDRFKGRLVQMATFDLELSVRVVVIQVLVAIDRHSLLEDEQREELCLLVYDEEPRVRKAVASFVRGVWEEAVDERMIGRKSGGDKTKDKERVGIKCLGRLLVRWGKRAGKGLVHVELGDEDDAEESLGEDGKNKDIARLVRAHHKGRIALTVEALWDDVEAIGDWEALLEHLLLDHSASVEDDADGVGPSPVAARRRQAAAAKKKAADEEVVNEAWRLSEPEETVLLGVFVATLKKTRDEAIGAKKGGEESTVSDITRALIKALPRLFAKHQTDSNRVADVLTLPQLMNVDMYLEMRMIPAYEGLWDDITKQFISHSSPVTLSHANATMQHLTSATLLSNTNNAKIVELEEELSTSLRDAVAGREELEIASFSEDEVHTLGAMASRLVVLATTRNMTGWMEEDEGGKQSSAWDIMNALAGRGRLGYKEEETMIDECLRLLTLHLVWKARGISMAAEPNDEEVRYRETLEEQRASVIEKLTEYAVGSDCRPCEGVKRAAFHNLLDIYILFCDSQQTSTEEVPIRAAAMPLTMDDETQYRCAGFLQAEIEQYVDDLEEATGGEKVTTTEDDSSRADSASEGEDGAAKKKGKKRKTRMPVREDSPDPRTIPRSRLEHEYILNSLLATFIRAIRVGVINPKHSAVVLAHYDRLGSAFDASIKVVIDFLRDIGMFRAQGQIVAEVIVQALQEAFTLFLDDIVPVDDHAVALARALTSCFVIRGAQLSVIKRLESEYVVEVHTKSILWIVDRLAASNASTKKTAKKPLHFFRMLQQLLSSVDSRDALKIKAHLDQCVAQAKLQVDSTKAWDSYRAYEKRLSTAMSKDKSLPSKNKAKRPKKGSKSAGVLNSDEDEAEVEGLVEGSGVEGDDTDSAPRPRRRPQPRPTRRQPSASEGHEGDDEDVFGPVSSPNLSSPSERRAAHKAPMQNEDTPGHGHREAPHNDKGVSHSAPHVAVNGNHTPLQTSPRKRRRDVSEPADLEGQENDDPSRGHASQAPSPSHSHTSVADIKNRRKRVRRR